MLRRRLALFGLAIAVASAGAALASRDPDAAVSPFEQPIPAGMPTDPRSSAMIDALVAVGRARGFVISGSEWTTPVYYADRQTRRRTVRLTAPWAPVRALRGVPIPESARPNPSADAHLTVIDDGRRCRYDFWQARRAGDGSWSASWANATDADRDVYAGGWAATASGFSNTAGKIWPDELERGEIAHALVFAFPHTKAGGPVAPATSSDGRSTLPGAIPEGARLQLDPHLDIDALGLTGWQRTIARALQVYGMFLGDTGGAVGLSAIDVRSFAGKVYPWGDAVYAELPVVLLEHMRVLRLPPQYRARGRLAGTRCVVRLPRQPYGTPAR